MGIRQSSAHLRPRPASGGGDQASGATEVSRRHSGSLEGLRGLAAVLVVVAHTLPNEGGFTLGVDIFFVLSGFLITRLVVDELARFGRVSLRTFYIRRAFRLFPALFVFLVAVVIWTQLLAPAIGIASVHGTVLSSLFYVENWHVIAVAHAASPAFPADPAAQTWSLSVEEQFYLIWPLVLVAAWKWKGPRAALAVAAAGLAISMVDIFGLAWFGTTYARVYFGSDTRFGELLAGCCVALLAQCGWLPRVGRVTIVASLGALLAIAALQPPLLLQMSAAAALGAVLVAGLSQHEVWPLNIAPARWLGKRSYALYLWHPFVAAILVYQFHAGDGIGMLACVLLVSLVVADVTYRVVEAPLRDFGRRIGVREVSPFGRLRATRSIAVAAPIA
jgi:peptidoglycan/LPS O-acetylase OafA/YrhL